MATENGETIGTALLVNFTNGTIVPECIGKLQAHLEKDPKPNDGPIQAIGGTAIKQPHKRSRYLIAETDKMKYRGVLETDQSSVSYYLGIRDPTTGKLQIIDASKVNMFPVFEKPGNDVGSDGMNVTFRDQRDTLTEEFGSLKKNRLLHWRRKLKLKDDALEKTLEDVADHHHHHSTSLEPTVTTVAVDTDICPPCNRQAKTALDVYQLNDIISDSEMDELYYPARLFINSTKEQQKEWKEDSVYPRYIINHLFFLPLNENARLLQSKCLMYQYYLMNLFSMKAKSLYKAYPLPTKWPISVRERLYSDFMLSTQKDNLSLMRCMPSHYKDKVLLYILVLALFIDDFQMEISDLVFDLKVDIAKILKMLKILGCRIKKNKIASATAGTAIETHLAVLTIPLPEVQLKTRRKVTNRKR